MHQTNEIWQYIEFSCCYFDPATLVELEYYQAPHFNPYHMRCMTPRYASIRKVKRVKEIPGDSSDEQADSSDEDRSEEDLAKEYDDRGFCEYKDRSSYEPDPIAKLKALNDEYWNSQFQSSREVESHRAFQDSERDLLDYIRSRGLQHRLKEIPFFYSTCREAIGLSSIASAALSY